jgi:hypothetical protein
MTKEDVIGIFEKAKHDPPSWQVVMNNTYTDEQVRTGVLLNLLKMLYTAIEHDGPVMRKPSESFEEAINSLVLHHTSYIPNREIEDVVETTMKHRRQWQQ